MGYTFIKCVAAAVAGVGITVLTGGIGGVVLVAVRMILFNINMEQVHF